MYCSLTVLLVFVAGSILVQSQKNNPLEEVFAWKELTFAWPSDEVRDAAIKSDDYIPANNLPLGLDRWKDKLFVTIPRWKAGVASTLTYISLNPANKTGSLTPYPDWKANSIKGETEANHIVSTFRVKVDTCDRLWVLDTGVADILGNLKRVSKTALVIFDLNTDKLIRRYELKKADQKEESFFANIVVDVSKDECDKAFAYVTDPNAFGMVVYSFSDNDSWRVKHNFFHPDPLKGDMNVGGVNFQWTDGVFGWALGPKRETGYRTSYFHPLTGTKEFSVSTQVLQNKTLAQDPHSYHLFKLEGERGDLTQSSASDFDEKSNVLFLTQLNRDGVACWNPRKPLNPQSLDLVAQDKDALIFTNDIKLDRERNLWALSDRMPSFVYKSLDPSQVNYRIFKARVDDLIKNTGCAA